MNNEWYWAILTEVQTNIWLQALVVVVGSWLLEDIVVIGCALLVASGNFNWQTALIILPVGIITGDMGLYLLGRFASGVIYRRKWLNRRRLLWAEHYFTRHRVKAVFLSRFLPGSRPFTYIAAGLLNTPFWRLLALVSSAAITQTIIYLTLARTVGAALLPYLENPWLRLAVVAAVISAIALIGLRLLRRYRQLEEEALLAAGTTPDKVVNSKSPLP
jgi:membrane protein DedA with SNARE-associated domain